MDVDMDASPPEIVTELHADLARKYRIHGAKLEAIWRSFNKAQKTQCMREGAYEGDLLKHRMDKHLTLWQLGPEWNIRDIAESSPDFFLDLLKHRATTDLGEQVNRGMNDGPGDYEHITEMMNKKWLRPADYKGEFYTFVAAEEYGKTFQVRGDEEGPRATLANLLRLGFVVPRPSADYIFQRQMYLLQCLNNMIEDILDEGSQTRAKAQPPKKHKKDNPINAFSGLTIQDAPTKVTLSEVATNSRDRKAALEERVELLSTEPVVLANAVNDVFTSRLELLPDEKGRMLPFHSDKHISYAIFETVHGEIQAAAIWAYITRLVELLEGQGCEKAYRTLILQELSNVCHMEYARAQRLFKRHIATSRDSKRFKRVSNAYDNAGNPRLIMKFKPEDLTASDPQFHYLLRLCQSETTATKAVDWMKKLGDLYTAHPLERERLDPRQADALFDLAIITGLLQDLSSAVSLPVPSRKKGQEFLRKFDEVESELVPLKTEIDLRDFAAPMDNLLEPGMAEGALEKLDSFIIDETGTKMGFLYEDIITESLTHLQSQYEQAKAQKKKDDKVQQEKNSQATPVPAFTEEPKEERIERRREKTKTRPSQASAYELTARDAPVAEESQPAPSPEVIKVSAQTGELFNSLFDKSQARGSISWASFEAAMAELGFSVFPKYGSVYTFCPPPHSTMTRSFTIHRPHGAYVEGYRILILARRLKRTYGWGEKTFKVE